MYERARDRRSHGFAEQAFERGVDRDGFYHSPNVCFFGPEIMAIATIASSVIGTGMSVMGQMQQASATADAARYQQQVAKNNQQIAQDNAAYSRQAAQEEAFRESQKTSALIGATEASQGAGGVDVGSGSPTDVVKAERTVGRLDMMQLLQQGDLRARGYDIAGSNYGAEAGLQSMKASNAQTAGLYSAGGSLMSGLSSVGSKWDQYTRPGGVFASTSSSLGDWSPRPSSGLFG